jgi:hypothetical protein
VYHDFIFYRIRLKINYIWQFNNKNKLLAGWTTVFPSKKNISLPDSSNYLYNKTYPLKDRTQMIKIIPGKYILPEDYS